MNSLSITEERLPPVSLASSNPAAHELPEAELQETLVNSFLFTCA